MRHLPQRRPVLGSLRWIAIYCCVAGCAQQQIDPEPRPFVEEVAPGVYIRDLNGIYSSNQIFVVFEEYVVVFDSGRAPYAQGLIDEIRARTDKPVRFVIHSHFHPDHTAGAALLAEKFDVEILAAEQGRDDFEKWARDDFAKKRRNSPEVYKNLEYPAPTRYVVDKEVFDDGQQRLEVMHLGHGHTKGDLVGWIPEHGILFTGDLCENRSGYNLANANLAEWIKVLDELRALPVKTILPGHGHVGDPEILDITRRYLAELRQIIGDMVARGMDFDEVLDAVEVPFFEEWTGSRVRDMPNSVAAAYREMGGIIEPSKPRTSKKRIAAVMLVVVLVGTVAIVFWRRAVSASGSSDRSAGELS